MHDVKVQNRPNSFYAIENKNVNDDVDKGHALSTGHVFDVNLLVREDETEEVQDDKVSEIFSEDGKSQGGDINDMYQKTKDIVNVTVNDENETVFIDIVRDKALLYENEIEKEVVTQEIGDEKGYKAEKDKVYVSKDNKDVGPLLTITTGNVSPIVKVVKKRHIASIFIRDGESKERLFVGSTRYVKVNLAVAINFCRGKKAEIIEDYIVLELTRHFQNVVNNVTKVKIIEERHVLIYDNGLNKKAFIVVLAIDSVRVGRKPFIGVEKVG